MQQNAVQVFTSVFKKTEIIIMKIIKRNSSEAEFDRDKIANAIRKANFASDPSERVTELAIENMTDAVTASCACLGRAPVV